MQESITNFITDNKDILITIIFSFVAIILALDEDALDKKYQKKIILVIYCMMYYLLIISNNIISVNKAMVYSLVMLGIVLIFFTINVSYSNEKKYLERELSVLDYFFLNFMKSFFITKYYIFILFVIIERLINGIPKGYSNTITILEFSFMILIPIYHLLSNSNDCFGTVEFSKTRDTVLENSKLVIKKTDEELMEISRLLSLLVYLEDKMLFDRKEVCVTLPSLLEGRKKYRCRILQSNSTKANDNKSLIRYSFKLVRSPLKALRTLKKYKRGYSTLLTQYIRISCMYPNSYNYTFRRKLFVEHIYCKLFYKSWRRFFVRIKFLGEDKSFDYVRTLTLLAYYKKVLEEPINELELINKLQSSGSKEILVEIANCFYEINGEHHIYREDLINRIYSSIHIYKNSIR
ncbi:hypothetical protein ACWN8B_00070 [Vagococcus zengguangii]|uniref:Uncharacterized protein n=1 Tax=Vagococcus zengguangii TaxID=2571750 RepID=A0A4D7CWE1_9ENTE|nr:hypothetical protein [Vagococcus zengguangii]QCI86316.1 hypothetical protein FA707_04760 [Vagococcus zengguangii]